VIALLCALLAISWRQGLWRISAEKATLLLLLLIARVGPENVLSVSGHRLRFAVAILYPCVVSRAEAGTRGPSDTEQLTSNS